MSGTEVATRSNVSAIIQEKVLLGGDLAPLTPAERLTYYNAVCTSVGLNPLTRPFEYLALNGKLQLYARKDCTDQLRDLHGISIQIVAREALDGCYVVTAQAKNMTERHDESVGAVPTPSSPTDKANAMMKAETKAKRRVTLSICGLGMLDETEVETIDGAYAVPPPPLTQISTVQGEGARGTGGITAENSSFTAQQASDAPAPLFKASTWVIPFGKSKGKLLSDVSDEDVDYLLNYYTGKLNDPANVNSRYRGEWEQAVIEVRGEMLQRYPGEQVGT